MKKLLLVVMTLAFTLYGNIGFAKKNTIGFDRGYLDAEKIIVNGKILSISGEYLDDGYELLIVYKKKVYICNIMTDIDNYMPMWCDFEDGKDHKE